MNRTDATKYPLPKSPSDAMYDMPNEDRECLLTSVSRKADGSFYGDTGEFDFSAPDEQAMIAKLKKWSARYVGWENAR